MASANSKKIILTDEQEIKFAEIGVKIKYIQTLMKILDSITRGETKLEDYELQHFITGIKSHIDNLEEMHDKLELDLGV